MPFKYIIHIFRITEEFTNSESTAQNGRKRRNTPTVFDYNTANTVELAYLVDTRWMRRYLFQSDPILLEYITHNMYRY